MLLPEARFNNPKGIVITMDPRRVGPLRFLSPIFVGILNAEAAVGECSKVWQGSSFTDISLSRTIFAICSCPRLSLCSLCGSMWQTAARQQRDWLQRLELTFNRTHDSSCSPCPVPTCGQSKHTPRISLRSSFYFIFPAVTKYSRPASRLRNV